MYTLFTKSLPLDVASRVWDVYCRDGEEFLFRTALGALQSFELASRPRSGSCIGSIVLVASASRRFFHCSMSLWLVQLCVGTMTTRTSVRPSEKRVNWAIDQLRCSQTGWRKIRVTVSDLEITFREIFYIVAQLACRPDDWQPCWQLQGIFCFTSGLWLTQLIICPVFCIFWFLFISLSTLVLIGVWFGVVVTALNTSTKLSYIEPS